MEKKQKRDKEQKKESTAIIQYISERRLNTIKRRIQNSPNNETAVKKKRQNPS